MLHFPITEERAPRISSRMRAEANEIARGGDIAIVGRCAPWSELSPSHRERFDPGALRSERDDMPPVLLAEHTSYVQKTRGPFEIPTLIGVPMASHSRVEGRSLDQYGPGGGFDCVWTVRRDLAAVSALFDNLANGVHGLSVEMKVRSASTVWEGWQRGGVRHIHEAVTWAVATVSNPSYLTARMDAIVTPEIVWVFDQRRQMLVPDVEQEHYGLVFDADYTAAMEWARRGEPLPDAQATAQDPAAVEARASRFAQLSGEVEFRSR